MIQRSVFALVVWLSAALAAGGAPRTVVVAGKVLDPHARPIGGAAVSVVAADFTDPFDPWGGPHTVRHVPAAADGSFRLEVPVQSDSWSINVLAFMEGYGPGQQYVWRGGSSIGLAVALSPPSFVAGRLVDAEGRPAAGARVSAKWVISGEGEGGYQIPHEVQPPAITDAHGRFRLAPLPANYRVELDVEDPRYVLPPGASDRIRTGAGDVTMAVLPAGAVTGRVVYDDGSPAAKVPLLCLTTGFGVPKEVTDADGRYRFARLPPGAFVVTPEPTEALASYEAEMQRAVLPVGGQARCPDLHLKRLPGSAVLSGKVTDEADGRPVAGVGVMTQRSLENTGMLNMPLNGPTARTEADGTYHMRLPPGTWHAYISDLPPGYRYGRPPSGPTALPAAPGKNLTRDLTVASEKGTMFAGTVLDADGRPAAAAKLRLWPGGIQTTDIDGRFRTALHIGPGGRPAGIVTRVAVLSLDRSQGVVLELRSSDVKGARTIRLRRLTPVAGRVTDAKGAPVPGAAVRADLLLDKGPWLAEALTTPLGATTTDTRGRFSLPLVPAVACRVSAQASGFAPDQHLVELKPGRLPALLELRLQRGGSSIAGVVVDPDGRPLPGVQIWIRPSSLKELRLASSPGAITDAEGRFQVEHLPPALVSVGAWLAGYYDERREKVKVGAANLRFKLLPMDRPTVPPTRLAIGARAPEISVVKWVNGEGPASLAALRGKTVLLQFSSAYNRASASTNAALAGLQTRLRAAGRDDVTILALYDSAASPEEVAAYARTEGLLFPIGVVAATQDPWSDSAAFQAYGVRRLPTVFVIDREGMIRAVDPTREELMQLAATREEPHHEK